jgi:Ca2+-binding EF-hand superfamily protein
MNISKDDVIDISKTINVTLTDEQIDKVLEMYPSEQDNDTSGTWDLVIENCIYQIIN